MLQRWRYCWLALSLRLVITTFEDDNFFFNFAKSKTVTFCSSTQTLKEFVNRNVFAEFRAMAIICALPHWQLTNRKQKKTKRELPGVLSESRKYTSWWSCYPIIGLPPDTSGLVGVYYLDNKIGFRDFHFHKLLSVVSSAFRIRWSYIDENQWGYLFTVLNGTNWGTEQV